MGEWQKGLFGCFENCGICIITYFVPCLTAGRNAEAVGESCVVYGILSILGPIGIWSRSKIRGMIRESKGIEVRVWFFVCFVLCGCLLHSPFFPLLFCFLFVFGTPPQKKTPLIFFFSFSGD